MIVSPITDLLRGMEKDITWGDAQESAFHKITILFTFGKTQILRHYDCNRPALVETDASDLAVPGVLSPTFEDGNLHPVSILSRKLSPSKLNYDIFDKEMLAIVFSLMKWRYYLQGVEHKTIVYSNNQNLTYFKTIVSLNRRQARWAEELQALILIYSTASVLQTLKQPPFLGAWHSPLKRGLQQPQEIKHCYQRNNGRK